MLWFRLSLGDWNDYQTFWPHVVSLRDTKQATHGIPDSVCEVFQSTQETQESEGEAKLSSCRGPGGLLWHTGQVFRNVMFYRAVIDWSTFNTFFDREGSFAAAVAVAVAASDSRVSRWLKQNQAFAAYQEFTVGLMNFQCSFRLEFCPSTRPPCFFFLISCKVEWLGPSLPNELRAFWFPDSYGICGTAANPTTRACPTVAVGKEYYYFLDFGLY